MAKQIYHIACYKAAKGRDASPKPARFRGYCFHCGKRVWEGDAITWPRNVGQSGSSGSSGGSTGETSGSGSEEHSTEADDGADETSAPDVPEAPPSPADLFNWKLLADGVYPHLQDRFAAHGGGYKPNVVEVRNVATDTSKDMGLQHKMYARLLKAVAARVNVWLKGPAGSGKTTGAHNVAKALDLPFYFTGALSDPYGLLGYMSATGVYVRTPFREAYEKGGVFLFDEVDGSDPTALVALNAALANGVAAFPDGMITKHPDCVVIAAANTWGVGGTAEYVGRMKQDAAFLNRFCKIDWDYDADLELATCADMAWCKRVQEVRAKVKAKGIRALITPRQSYYGAQLLATGLTKEEVEEMLLASEMTPEQWASVR